MVEIAGAKAGARDVHPLRESGEAAAEAADAPIAVHVEADAGWPIALVERGVRRAVESVEDIWRIEDGWRRRTPVSRTYFEVLLEDGRRLSIFHDHLREEWRRQRYAPLPDSPPAAAGRRNNEAEATSRA